MGKQLVLFILPEYQRLEETKSEIQPWTPEELKIIAEAMAKRSEDWARK